MFRLLGMGCWMGCWVSELEVGLTCGGWQRAREEGKEGRWESIAERRSVRSMSVIWKGKEVWFGKISGSRLWTWSSRRGK